MKGPEGRIIRITVPVSSRLPSSGRPISEAGSLFTTNTKSLSKVGSSRVESLEKRIPTVTIMDGINPIYKSLSEQQTDSEKEDVDYWEDANIKFPKRNKTTISGFGQNGKSKIRQREVFQPLHRLEPVTTTENTGTPTDSYKKVSPEDLRSLVPYQVAGFQNKPDYYSEKSDIATGNQLLATELTSKEVIDTNANHIIFISHTTFQDSQNRPVDLQLFDQFKFDSTGKIDSQKTLAIYTVKNLMLLVYEENNRGINQNVPFSVNESHISTDIQKQGSNHDELPAIGSENKLQYSLLPVYFQALLGLLTDEQINQTTPVPKMVIHPLVPNSENTGTGIQNIEDTDSIVSESLDEDELPAPDLLNVYPSHLDTERDETKASVIVAVIIFASKKNKSISSGVNSTEPYGFDGDNPNKDGGDETRDDYSLAA